MDREEVQVETLKGKTLAEKVAGGFRQHFIDNLALTASAVPFFALVETTKGHMTWQESLATRTGAFLLGLAGVGSLYSRGSDWTRKIINVSDRTNEFAQWVADITYCAGFNFLASMVLYPITANKSLDEAFVPALWAGVTGAVVGIPNRAALSVYRDLTNIAPCERTWYPQFMRDLEKNTKLLTATTLTAGSAALTAGIYYFTNQSNIISY